MFTGIIREVGVLKATTRHKKEGMLSFEIGATRVKPRLGDSICVNGVCLTVTKKNGKSFSVDVIPESLTRSNLGGLKKGAPLNLEASIKAGEAFDGHFVSGHIDATARLMATGKIRHGTGLTLSLPSPLRPYLAEKGTITVNGVSLTVVDVTKSHFTVALIPFTMTHTNLGHLWKNDIVNLEIDLIARYLHRFTTYKK